MHINTNATNIIFVKHSFSKCDNHPLLKPFSPSHIHATPTQITMASFLVFTSYIVVIFGVSNGYINGVDAARAFFVFGDSLVDNGNNNYLASLARADSPPYGIDYPTGEPTGRFSNGLNIPDLISCVN